MNPVGLTRIGAHCMRGNVFVDTNILVYARDRDAAEKQAKAETLMLELWESRRGRISAQVLNEFFVIVTRKLKPGMSPEEAWSEILLLRAWDPVALDWPLLARAREIHHAHSVSWWDALIVAAANASDCAVLYSEDLAHGSVYGDVQVENPFI